MNSAERLEAIIDELDLPLSSARRHALREVLTPIAGPLSGFLSFAWSSTVQDDQKERNKKAINSILLFLLDNSRIVNSRIETISSKLSETEALLESVQIITDNGTSRSVQEILTHALSNSLFNETLPQDEVTYIVTKLSRLDKFEIELMSDIPSWADPRIELQLTYGENGFCSSHIPELSIAQIAALDSLISNGFIEGAYNSLVATHDTSLRPNIIRYDLTDLGALALSLIQGFAAASSAENFIYVQLEER